MSTLIARSATASLAGSKQQRATARPSLRVSCVAGQNNGWRKAAEDASKAACTLMAAGLLMVSPATAASNNPLGYPLGQSPPPEEGPRDDNPKGVAKQAMKNLAEGAEYENDTVKGSMKEAANLAKVSITGTGTTEEASKVDPEATLRDVGSKAQDKASEAKDALRAGTDKLKGGAEKAKRNLFSDARIAASGRTNDDDQPLARAADKLKGSAEDAADKLKGAGSGPVNALKSAGSKLKTDVSASDAKDALNSAGRKIEGATKSAGRKIEGVTKDAGLTSSNYDNALKQKARANYESKGNTKPNYNSGPDTSNQPGAGRFGV